MLIPSYAVNTEWQEIDTHVYSLVNINIAPVYSSKNLMSLRHSPESFFMYQRLSWDTGLNNDRCG